MPAEMDDVIEIPAYERRDDVRVIVNLPGRYMLANKRNLNGERCEFACRMVNISLAAMALAVPVPGAVGERVIVYTEQFGRLHGAITRLMTTGFVMSIAANEQTRERLAAKLDWLEKQKESPELTDSRRHARFHCNGGLSLQKRAISVCSGVRLLPTAAPSAFTSL